MGKNTGFLDYAVKANGTRSPLNLTGDFRDIHEPLPKEERRTQASRRMNCGVPM